MSPLAGTPLGSEIVVSLLEKTLALLPIPTVRDSTNGDGTSC